MAEGTLEQRAPARPFGGLGFAPAMLIAAAAGHFALAMAAQASTGQPALLEPARLASHLTAASSFVLAATVLLGLDRWPRARAWMIAGVIALVVRGLLDVALEAWMWWTSSLAPWSLADLDQTFPSVRGMAALLAGAAAPALLAIGLLATPSTSPGNPARRRATAAVAALGLVALLAGALIAFAVVDRSPMPFFDASYYLLIGLSYAGMAAVGALALHRLPAHYRMPELLIGAGAALAVAGGWWHTIVLLDWLVNGPSDALGWLLTLPAALELLGLAALIGGFAVARIVPPRTARPPERSW